MIALKGTQALTQASGLAASFLQAPPENFCWKSVAFSDLLSHSPLITRTVASDMQLQHHRRANASDEENI